MSPDVRPNPAVVTGLDTMQGLQTARLLAARGVEVHGVVTNAEHPFASTRSCRSVTLTESTDTLPTTLDEIAEHFTERAVVVPCQDAAVAAVSLHRQALEHRYIVALPSHDVVITLLEKSRFHAHATAHGLPVPRSFVLDDRMHAEHAAAELTYPCVLKPSARSAEWSSQTTTKAFEVASPGELLGVYDRVSTWAASMIVQEWIVGPETNLISVNAYFGADGQPLATFVARKIRQWPVSTGQSSLGVECRDDEALELALRTFATVPYRGLAYLEMKRDSRTGTLSIIEPNIGRPTGRSAIAEAGGVELLDTMYCDAVGLPLPSLRTQSYGEAKWIHLRRDLMASTVLAKRRELTLSAWRASIRGPKFYAIWDRRDPRPFFGDLSRVAREALSNVRRRATSS